MPIAVSYSIIYPWLWHEKLFTLNVQFLLKYSYFFNLLLDGCYKQSGGVKSAADKRKVSKTTILDIPWTFTTSSETLTAELVLQTFHHFTYVAAHSPTLLLLHLRHSSFSNPPFASSMSQALHLVTWRAAHGACWSSHVQHFINKSPHLQTSLPSTPYLFCFGRSALASCTWPGTGAGNRVLTQRAWDGHRWFIPLQII